MYKFSSMLLSFSLIFSSAINSKTESPYPVGNFISSPASTFKAFSQKTSEKCQKKVQKIKETTIMLAKKTGKTTLGIAISAAPVLIFAAKSPLLTVGMTPLATFATTVKWALLVGLASGQISTLFNKESKN